MNNGLDLTKALLGERWDSPILEIGPFINPLMHKDYLNVYYSDIRSKDEIFEYYQSEYKDARDVFYEQLMDIDFVIKDSYEATIAEKAGDMKFALIYSSHVIEHVNDVIFHLQDLSKVLEDNGYIAMLIPDKRYTFDHFREVTPFRDMLDVYLNGTINSTARFVFDEVFSSHPNNNMFEYHKGGISFSAALEDESIDKYEKAIELYKCVRDEGYVSSGHNWVFTYESFLDFLRDGLRANLLPYRIHHSVATKFNENGFFIILQKDMTIMEDKEKRKAEIKKIIEIREAQI